MNNLQVRVLDRQDLQHQAPSIFAEQAYSQVSDKYEFFNTARALAVLEQEGWQPFKVMESRVRYQHDKPSKEGFQKHLIRLFNPNMPGTSPDDMLNIVLINSHDRSTAFKLMAGIFRLICSNGLIIGDQICPPVQFKHIGTSEADVIDAEIKIIDNLPMITDSIQNLKSVQLSESEQIAFARAALELRWPKNEQEQSTAPIPAEKLLFTRRSGDSGSDLYTTFNKVQENLIDGGLRGRSSTGGRMRTRGVNSVDQNVRLNKSLWTLADEMARIKQAA